MAEGVRSWLSPSEELRQDAEEYREIDGERVFVLHRYRGRAKRSGVDLGQMQAKAACIFHVRGRQVTRLVLYWESKRVLADLGLTADGDGQ